MGFVGVIKEIDGAIRFLLNFPLLKLNSINIRSLKLNLITFAMLSQNWCFSEVSKIQNHSSSTLFVLRHVINRKCALSRLNKLIQIRMWPLNLIVQLSIGCCGYAFFCPLTSKHKFQILWGYVCLCMYIGWVCHYMLIHIPYDICAASTKLIRNWNS